jgi:[acyl-carrier-protein] S-malonyltransferase
MNNQLGMVFPGQGSQSLGMLMDVADAFEEVKATFTHASHLLQQDLWELVKVGPKEKLDQTVYTQPVLLTAAYAIWQILTSHGITPDILAGHSLGEYTALVCAKVLSFSDALSLVVARGKYMQDAVPEGVGAMAAILGLENEAVDEICKESSQGLIIAPANFNSIGQVVIAGEKLAIERAMLLAKNRGAKMAVLIPVSVPSHCSLMKGAADKMAILLNNIKINPPQLPVVSNVDAKPYTNAANIREGLIKQLCSPVRWVETIQWFVNSGVTRIIECGPGKVLTGLNKRIHPSLSLLNTFNLIQLQTLLAEHT